MADIASLGIVVKTQGVQQSTAELKQLAKEGEASAVAAEKTGKAWGAAFGLAASAFVVGGITAIIKATIESDRVQKQLEQRVRALGSSSARSAKQVDALATSLQNASTFDDESIKRAATALLAFTNIKPGNFNRAMQDIADLAASTGDDIIAVTDKVGKALNNPLTASRSLREAGIELTKSQKDLLKSLLDNGDAAGAQALILGELEHRYAGAAAAARDTLGGALKGLKNDFENLLEGDGKGVTGTTEAINHFAETLRSEGVRSGFATVVNGLFSLADVAAKVVSAFTVSAQRIGILVAEIANQADALYTITKNVQTFGLASGTISDSVAKMRAGFAQFKAEDAALVASFHAVGNSAKGAAANVAGYTKEVRGTGVFADVNTDGVAPPKPAKAPRAARSGGGSSISRESLDLTKGAADDLKALAEREQQATEQFKDMAATLAGPLAEALRDHEKRVAQLNDLAKKSPEAAAGLNQALKDEAARYALVTTEYKKALNPFGQLLEEKEHDLRLMRLQGVARDIEIDQQRLGRQLTEEETAALREKNQALEDGAKGAQLQQQFQSELASSITDFVTGAKSAKDAAKGFFDTMAKYITQMIAENWAKKIGDLMSGSSSSGASGSGSGTNWFGMIASLFGGGSANGNAFAGGNVQAFANGGVVDRTTAFGMSGGRFGIMGEAGPEAILPLHRGPDGKLGVRMEASNDSHMRPVVNNNTTFLLPERMRPETQAQISQNQQRAASRATSRNR